MDLTIQHIFPTILHRNYAVQRKQDIATLLSDKELLPRHTNRYTYQKVSNEIILSAVDFILDGQRTQVMSWGTRKHVLDDHEHYVLPKIIRTCLREDMFNEYKQTFPKSHQLGQTLFLWIASNVTTSDYKSITCVDYVLGNLINESIERLQHIIEQLFSRNHRSQKHYSLLLGHTRTFLKSEFDSHLLLDDGDGFHSLGHALTKTKDNNNLECRIDSCQVCNECNWQNIKCYGCRFPFWFCNKLGEEVQEAIREGTGSLNEEKLDQCLQVITYCREKFALFMKHRTRVVCQREASNKFERAMIASTEDTHTYSNLWRCTIDFKMKYEGISARETMPENFGKRGMGWHGAGRLLNFTNGTGSRKLQSRK